MHCKVCRYIISKNTKVCPHCGAEVKEEENILDSILGLNKKVVPKEVEEKKVEETIKVDDIDKKIDEVYFKMYPKNIETSEVKAEKAEIAEVAKLDVEVEEDKILESKEETLSYEKIVEEVKSENEFIEEIIEEEVVEDKFIDEYEEVIEEYMPKEEIKDEYLDGEISEELYLQEEVVEEEILEVAPEEEKVIDLEESADRYEHYEKTKEISNGKIVATVVIVTGILAGLAAIFS